MKQTIQCEICKKDFSQLTRSHLRYTHEITIAEYREQFPDAPFESEAALDFKSKRFKGKVRSASHQANLTAAIQNGYANGRKANKGMLGKTRSQEVKEKALATRAISGYKHSEETKNLISLGNSGKIMPREAVERQQASLKLAIEANGGGFATGPRSDEFCTRMSEIAKARTTEQIRCKVDLMNEARRGSKATDEQKENYRVGRLKWMRDNPDAVAIKYRDTKPELEFEQELIKRNIKYRKQFHTSRPHYLYDFLVADKYLIEIDGPYHYNPKMHSTYADYESQILRDAAKNLAAGKNGLYILRIEVGNHLPDDWKDVLLVQDLDIDLLQRIPVDL